MTYVVDFPAGSGPFPAIVIAPGLRYAMHRELFSLLADKAVAAGFAVGRFNWRFYESDPLAGQPSSALQDELQQLKEVIGQLRAESRVLPAQVHVVGKSFGSIIAWQALRDDAELKSGVLITPLFDEMQDGKLCDVSATHYPGLLAETRPLQIVCGDNDPHCTVASLHRIMDQAAANLTLRLLRGDHLLQIHTPDMQLLPHASAENLALAADAVVQFLLSQHSICSISN
ncbi:hypothetical protein KDM87_06425 [Undibacterium sp. FT147W]|uniref:KANL3/Tex30 alpha/beta hydrolase-like domain-containing protein n=1 Tax=Undibacterium rivi TaxID=2828729 RepID=A0ABS5H1G6_9BURK|nr:alpha/beta family hydrolase [Undibacterium rivi]MBR7792229.1 hypothetical protein [Undibacterium rivi]